MKSLRIRLLVVLSGVLLVVWLVWTGLGAMQLTRQQSGWLDESLRDVGNQILTSLPEYIVDTPFSSTALTLPPGKDAAPMKDLSFQVWILPGRLALHSARAPRAPLRPGFEDGFAVERVGGQSWRVYAITDASGRVQVQVGKPETQLVAMLWLWAKATLATTALIFLVLAIALWLVLGWSLRPATRLQRALAARDRLDLTPLPTADLPGEFLPLVESFNRLLDRVERAIRSERQLIADAAHELRTPLAAVQAHAQVALRAGDPQEQQAALARLVAAVERGTRLTQQLLDSARLDASQSKVHAPVDLAELVSVVTHEFDLVARQRRQTISLQTLPCAVPGDTDELGILVRNLLDNALRYGAQGGRVAVSCGPVADAAPAHRSDRDGVCLRVLDDGPGVPEPARLRIFDRFFRIAGNGQRGSGIGLSLVQRIAQSHQARIEVGTGLDGRGFGVSLRFPSA